MATYGYYGDISYICQFWWYEYVCAQHRSKPFLYMIEPLGHCLGPSNIEGNEITQWVLKLKRQVVPQ